MATVSIACPRVAGRRAILVTKPEKIIPAARAICGNPIVPHLAIGGNGLNGGIGSARSASPGKTATASDRTKSAATWSDVTRSTVPRSRATCPDVTCPARLCPAARAPFACPSATVADSTTNATASGHTHFLPRIVRPLNPTSARRDIGKRRREPPKGKRQQRNIPRETGSRETSEPTPTSPPQSVTHVTSPL
jgi:hypothetical protein